MKFGATCIQQLFVRIFGIMYCLHTLIHSLFSNKFTESGKAELRKAREERNSNGGLCTLSDLLLL